MLTQFKKINVLYYALCIPSKFEVDQIKHVQAIKIFLKCAKRKRIIYATPNKTVVLFLYSMQFYHLFTTDKMD